MERYQRLHTAPHGPPSSFLAGPSRFTRLCYQWMEQVRAADEYLNNYTSVFYEADSFTYYI
ncbi:hypothetical protein E2C01_076068 [Portunus trituberculatus]|uniref:Uncharacterized protein n=1 Tax=Portunus trituberculatus TaxID=210409 RepID=A0A5B7I7R5_PORTR|nr:hypothetical protein [Portunus trituberculatus]